MTLSGLDRFCMPDQLATRVFTDIHCHCLPGLDDGPRSMGEALLLCQALVEDGITEVIATPHQLGRFDGCCDAPSVRRAVAQLNQTLRQSDIVLTVLPGADVRLDERILPLLEADNVLTAGDGGLYLLLEPVSYTHLRAHET